jgi:putative membrane-bound dehydrogenase-like protein
MKRLSLIASWFVLAASSPAASPLSPADELKSFQLADPNLTVDLVAAEPDVRAPVAVAWDADGRMFVAEMTDYPSGPVNGRIRLLEDRNGDGRYEHGTIFATNLAFPNGITPWRNGVLVTAAPHIWFLADTNGDGSADVREKVLTGFAEGNQQLRVNGLFWGIDNWIYGANGRSDGEVKWADGWRADATNTSGTSVPLSIRRHDFRFRPDTRQFEVIAGNSQFGMGHDDWGNRFPVFNNTPIRHVVVEDRYLARQPSLAGIDNVPSISPANDGNRVFALTPPTLLIPQPIGFFTSACGPSVYRGTMLPEAYRGNYFVCEPVQNVVQRRVLKPNGPTFLAEYADAEVAPVALRPETARSASRPTLTPREFLASTDRWFHGVFMATGPDGALYIVDFYRDLVEHPHWVAPELRDKVDWRKGEEHGRIWRVRAKNAKVADAPKLSRASNPQLVQALENENGWIRDTAHRLLVERNGRDAVPALRELARKGAKAQSRVHALNTLEGLGVNDMNVLLACLRDADARVREHAARLAERYLASAYVAPAVQEQLRKTVLAMTSDDDAGVRLQIACSLGALADDEARLAALTRLTQHAGLDQWQSIAILASAGQRPWLLARRISKTAAAPSEEQLALLERAARVIAAGTNAEDKEELMVWLANWPRIERVAVAAAFADGLPAKPASKETGRGRLLATMGASAVETARNPDAPLRIRLAAVRLMGAEESARLLNASEPEPLQVAAVRSIMDSDQARAIQTAFALWDRLAKSVRRQLVASSPRSRHAALELLQAVTAERVAFVEVDPATRQALEKSSDAEVKSRAIELFKRAVSPDREAVVQKYQAALKLKGDRARGAAVFEKNCTVCHQMQGIGAKVGPDLSGTGQQPRETLLVQILDPSRQVLPDFVAYNAETKSADTYTGFIANESATTVTLRRANEPDITLQRSELKELKTSGKSLMPDGMEAAINEQDMADLIEFLRWPDRTLFTKTE